jgi:hypothetical protein
MRFPIDAMSCVAAALLLVCAATAGPEPDHEKTVWNYDGGVVLITNGSIPNGPCFRINGRMNAPGFFDHLKRVDTDEGTTFRHGSETVTHFPDFVVLSFVVHDFYDKTCPPKAENGGTSAYLTRAMMSTLELDLYWKHGVELHPIRNVEKRYFSVEPVKPFADPPPPDLPERLQWAYQFVVPSAGVPLTDSLVVVLRTADGHMAARVAARL